MLLHQSPPISALPIQRYLEPVQFLPQPNCYYTIGGIVADPQNQVSPVLYQQPLYPDSFSLIARTTLPLSFVSSNAIMQPALTSPTSSVSTCTNDNVETVDPVTNPKGVILDIHQQYANGYFQGINPHLMSEKELATRFHGYSQCMQVVWHSVMAMLTAAFYPHKYELSPLLSEDKPDDTWHDCKEDAKVRFKCSACDKGWTSMKGKVVFHFRLDTITGQGIILFRLFGQQCNSCVSGQFEHAMWYPQEVIRVLKVLVYKIGQTIYDLPKPKVLRERRGGSPSEKHEKELCQACAHGHCSVAA